MPRVFEKFYRGQSAKQKDRGVGLGLTICRAVVRAHGGSIDVFARKRGGTRVRFTLPLGVAATIAHLPIEERPEA